MATITHLLGKKTSHLSCLTCLLVNKLGNNTNLKCNSCLQPKQLCTHARTSPIPPSKSYRKSYWNVSRRWSNVTYKRQALARRWHREQSLKAIWDREVYRQCELTYQHELGNWSCCRSCTFNVRLGAVIQCGDCQQADCGITRYHYGLTYNKLMQAVEELSQVYQHLV